MSQLLTPEQWTSFKWRVYNVFKSIVFPVVVSIILLDLKETPGDLSGLFHAHLWIEIGYAVLVSLLGSFSAGLEKVTRMISEENIKKGVVS